MVFFQYVMTMETKSEVAFGFPTYLSRDDPVHVTCYLICVVTYILNHFIWPGNRVADVGMRPVPAYTCHLCNESFEDRNDRDDHTVQCLEKHVSTGFDDTDHHLPRPL